MSYGYALSDGPGWYRAAWQETEMARAGVDYSDWAAGNTKSIQKLQLLEE